MDIETTLFDKCFANLVRYYKRKPIQKMYGECPNFQKGELKNITKSFYERNLVIETMTYQGYLTYYMARENIGHEMSNEDIFTHEPHIPKYLYIQTLNEEPTLVAILENETVYPVCE